MPEPVTNSLLPNQSFKFFFQDSEWTIKTGIGGLFNALSLVILTINLAFLPISFCLWALVAGYVLSVANLDINEQNTGDQATSEFGLERKILPKTNKALPQLPEWRNWLELFVSGLTWIAVATVLLLTTMAVLPFSIILASLCNAFQGTQTGLSGALVWVIASWSLFMIAAAVMSFFASYLMINFAKGQNVTYALSFSQVTERLKNQPLPLIQAWLIYLGLILLSILLPLVTVIGVFLIPSTIFVAQVVGSHLLARAWRAAG